MIRAMGRGDRMNIVSTLAPAVLSLGLFYLSAIAPPLGLLTPAPLYYSLVVYGYKTGAAIIAGAGLFVLLASGPGSCLLFLAMFGVAAFALAESHRRGESLEAAMGRATLAAYIAAGAVFLLSAALAGEGPGAILAAWARDAVDALTKSYSGMELGQKTAEWFNANGNFLVESFVRVFPGLSFISVMLMVAVNMLVIRAVSLRSGWGIHPAGHSLAGWKTPDAMVWGVVAGGFGIVLFEGVAETVFLNLLMVSLAVYMVQGVALAHFMFMRFNIPVPIRALGYFVIFSYPLFIGIVCAFGLMDTWMDFRERWAPKP